MQARKGKKLDISTQNHRTEFAREFQNATSWMEKLSVSIKWLEYLNQVALVEIADLFLEAATGYDYEREQSFEKFKEILTGDSAPDTLADIKSAAGQIRYTPEGELFDFLYNTALEETIDVTLIEDFVAMRTREERIEIMLELNKKELDWDRVTAIRDMIPELSGNNTDNYFSNFQEATGL